MHNYDALQTYELKLCFLYLATYREDEEIDADQLIELWLPEGLVKSREDGRHGFLKTLANRCLVEIEVKEENGLEICKIKIHDVLRDMAVHITEINQNTLFHAEGFLEKLNMLKVLDLSNMPIKSLPNSINRMKHLLYLLLSNTQIKVIPRQIFELSTVQFLDLSFSPLKSIPSMINKLKSLQILKLAHCYDLEFVTCEISKLTCFEELDMWQSTTFAYSEEERKGGELREASLQDICKLHRLKCLCLTLKSPIKERIVGNLVELQKLWLLWRLEVCQTHLPTDMLATVTLRDPLIYSQN
ncbi:hypothetical protein SUGI_0134250 [Cryptomeria japonica]|nr:hypothetical protein SUGI_0134250 [Cryptomeria japonica]